VNEWVSLHALWQILVVGLICGAGLPTVFGLGVRALSTPASRQAAASDSDRMVGEAGLASPPWPESASRLEDGAPGPFLSGGAPWPADSLRDRVDGVGGGAAWRGWGGAGRAGGGGVSRLVGRRRPLRVVAWRIAALLAVLLLTAVSTLLGGPGHQGETSSMI
jgi:hypothetical protein